MNLKLLAVVTITLFCLSCGAVYLLTLPAIIPAFNLSTPTASSIGTALAGLTGPVLNGLTIYFVWQTFISQKKTNLEQQGKNEQDLIVELMNSLLTEYNLIEISSKNKSVNGEETIYTGTKAFMKFARLIAENKIERYTVFRNQMTGDSILYVIYSFKSIMMLIESSSLADTSKHILREKMKCFFTLKMEAPLKLLAENFKNESDKYAVDLVTFYNTYSHNHI